MGQGFIQGLGGRRLPVYSESALKSYTKALEVAKKIELPTTQVMRLGLISNFSVFHYEILNDIDSALAISKSGLDDFHGFFERLPKEHKKEAVSIIELIRENMVVWSNELKEAMN